MPAPSARGGGGDGTLASSVVASEHGVVHVGAELAEGNVAQHTQRIAVPYVLSAEDVGTGSVRWSFRSGQLRAENAASLHELVGRVVGKQIAH